MMERKNRPRIRFFILLGVFAVLCIPRIVNLVRNTAKLRFYQAETERLTRENEALKEKISRMKDDPYMVEKVARDSMGLMKDGEYVFKIKKEKNVSR